MSSPRGRQWAMQTIQKRGKHADLSTDTDDLINLLAKSYDAGTQKGYQYYSIVQDLYDYLIKLYALSKGSPVNERHLVIFLVRRVEASDIPPIIEIAERTGKMSRITGTDTYIPAKPAE